MLKVGLTGGIGSGKTTVAKMFAQLGAPIIDADLVAKELTLNPEIHQRIINKFGNDVLLSNGQLNRKKIREIIFTTPYLKKWLEDLLHPLIRESITEKVKNIFFPYCLIAIPLLVENQLFSFINRILVVKASVATQIIRVTTRDKIKQEDVLKIINLQATDEQRLAVADDVIHNDGNLEQLMQQVKKLHTLYLNAN